VVLDATAAVDEDGTAEAVQQLQQANVSVVQRVWDVLPAPSRWAVTQEWHIEHCCRAATLIVVSVVLFEALRYALYYDSSGARLQQDSTCRVHFEVQAAVATVTVVSS
jgi:hypothetical protein